MTDVKQKYEYFIHDLSLSSRDGSRSIRLDGVFDELTLVESVFNNTMMGSIRISDTNGIYEALPIQGDEYIHIDFSKSKDILTDESRIQYTGYIYKVADKQFTDDKLNIQSYTLFFTSIENMLNRKYKVSNNIVGTASDICNTIFSNEIVQNKLELAPLTKRHPNTMKQLEVEDCLDTDSITFPNLSPFKAINHLARSAYASSPRGVYNTLYFFFEARDSFKFQSLEKFMWDAEETVEEFFFRIPGTNDDDISYYSMRTITSYNEDTVFDILNASHGGLYGSTHVTFDPLTKRSYHNKFDHDNYFSGLIHVDNYKNVKNDFFESGMERSKITTGTTSLGSKESTYISGKEDTYYTMENSVYQLKASRMRQLMGGKVVSFQVPGNPHRKIGEVVDLKLPSLVKDGQKQKAGELDKYHSGRHLIVEIKHMLTVGNYSMEITALKDSVRGSF